MHLTEVCSCPNYDSEFSQLTMFLNTVTSEACITSLQNCQNNRETIQRAISISIESVLICIDIQIKVSQKPRNNHLLFCYYTTDATIKWQLAKRRHKEKVNQFWLKEMQQEYPQKAVQIYNQFGNYG